MDYPWLRLWNAMLTSPKVQLLTDRDHRAWITLLVIANQGKPRGVLPGLDHIAFHLRCTVAEASEIMQRLHEADLMDEVDGKWSPHDWIHWQPKGDKPSTSRVQEYRKRCGNVSNVSTYEGNTASGGMKPQASSSPESGYNASTNTGNVSETVSQRFPSVSSSSLTTTANMDVKEENIIQRGNVSETFHENVDVSRCPDYPDPATSMVIIHTGQHVLDDGEARDIWRRIWASWKDERLCLAWYEHQRWFSADTWVAAFGQVRKQYGVDRSISIGLVEKIAADVDANGKREAKPPAPSSNGRPMTKREQRAEATARKLAELRARIGDDNDIGV
jgi:hypothetical protein